MAESWQDPTLPCPFCGGEAHTFQSEYEDGLVLWNTRCTKCYAAHDGHPKERAAREAWNKRVEK
jgi:Lar family restriction alleviation protein